jgi:hypothetical protein
LAHVPLETEAAFENRFSAPNMFLLLA